MSNFFHFHVRKDDKADWDSLSYLDVCEPGNNLLPPPHPGEKNLIAFCDLPLHLAGGKFFNGWTIKLFDSLSVM